MTTSKREMEIQRCVEMLKSVDRHEKLAGEAWHKSGNYQRSGDKHQGIASVLQSDAIKMFPEDVLDDADEWIGGKE